MSVKEVSTACTDSECCAGQVYTQLQTRCRRKMKKGKGQIGIDQANKPNEFICRIRVWTSYLPVGIAFVLKLILVRFWCHKKQAILPGAPCEDRGNWD